eukprot:ANDGO_06450.mRNA.1 hypothetical protein ACA1_203060
MLRFSMAVRSALRRACTPATLLSTPISRCSDVSLFVPVALFVIASKFYAASLRTGDLEFVHAELPSIARDLFLSATCYFFGFLSVLYSINTRKQQTSMYHTSWGTSVVPFKAHAGHRVPLLCLCFGIASLVFLFLCDRGTTLEHHGSYNSLVHTAFSALLWLSFAFVVIIQRIGRKNTKLILCFIAFAVFFFLASFSLRIRNGNTKWNTGLFGESFLLVRDPRAIRCDIQTPAIPWYDVLDGLLDVDRFSFSDHCVSKASSPLEIQAEFDDTSTLIIARCRRIGKYGAWMNSEGISSSAPPMEVRLIEVPRTEHWDISLKLTLPIYQQEILNRMQQSSRHYKLHNSAESVVVDVSNSDSESFLLACYSDSASGREETSEDLVLTRVVKSTSSKHTEAFNPAQNLGMNLRPNVILLYLDTLSRRHFFRKLQKTAAVLERLSAESDVDVFQFFRYHAVGITTVPNDKALFLGISEYSTEKEAKPIWELFSESGYKTAHVDNSCQDFSVKYQNKSSFFDNEFVPLFCHDDYYPVDIPFGVFQGPFSIRRRCLKSRFVHEYALDYSLNWWDAHSGDQRFLWTALTEGHEGTGEVIKSIDEDVADFLEELLKRKAFDDSVVVIVSDHGQHMSLPWAVQMHQARLENAFPALFMSIPRSLAVQKADASRNLLENQHRLVSGYDVFATLKSIAASESHHSSASGISLLHRIPDDRSCHAAGIPEARCFCAADRPRENDASWFWW